MTKSPWVHKGLEASAKTGFSANRLDRLSEKRDENSVLIALEDQRSRVLLFAADRVIMKKGDAPDPLFSREEAKETGADFGSTVLLGADPDENDRSLLTASTSLDPEDMPEDFFAIDLRSLAMQSLVSADLIGAIAQARSVLAWHATHGFCPNCGSKTKMAAGGLRRDCPSCERQNFPRVDPVVIMLAINGDHCLLGRQGRFNEGMYSCLAGFVEPGETIENAVRRETYEESGIQLGGVRYHASQPWPFVSSIMIGCHAQALTNTITMDEEELDDCRWFSRQEVRAMMEGVHPNGLSCPPVMAIAHEIIRAFVEGDVEF